MQQGDDAAHLRDGQGRLHSEHTAAEHHHRLLPTQALVDAPGIREVTQRQNTVGIAAALR